jgi:hypothetical protein
MEKFGVPTGAGVLNKLLMADFVFSGLKCISKAHEKIQGETIDYTTKAKMLKIFDIINPHLLLSD